MQFINNRVDCSIIINPCLYNYFINTPIMNKIKLDNQTQIKLLIKYYCKLNNKENYISMVKYANSKYT